MPQSFLRDGMPYRVEFGKGLANGAPDLRIYWQQLVIQLDLQHKSQRDVSVIRGFIEETHSIDSALAQELLDQCAQHSELRFELVNLHPGRSLLKSIWIVACRFWMTLTYSPICMGQFCG